MFTVYHIFHIFFKKVLEHFWKVWYIIAILVRDVSQTNGLQISF